MTRQFAMMVGWLGLDAVGAILEAPDSSTYRGLRDLALLALPACSTMESATELSMRSLGKS